MFMIIYKSMAVGAALLLTAASQTYGAGLYVCNETQDNLSVAYAGFESNIWVSHGWYDVGAYACTQLTSSFTNTRYYVYASGSSGKQWGANHYFCVNQNAGFNIPFADNTAACTNRAFFSVWVPDMLSGQFPDHYTVVIGPQLTGANNNALNHPRAER
jgi:uncharacterized membrane protein